METGEILMGGLKLMVAGMATVYAFLILMIGFMELLRRVVSPIVARQEEIAAAAAAASAKKRGNSGADADLAAVAAAVITAHRNK